MNDVKKYWRDKTNSLHRFDSTDYFRMKADEHIAIVRHVHRKLSCIDLGCGAGELLQFMLPDLNIQVGLDFSERLLIEAERRLSGKGIILINADYYDYLSSHDHNVWITSGALNQYLPPYEQRRLLDLFMTHPNSQALYLFDCVDPIRWRILPFGIKYVTSNDAAYALDQGITHNAYYLIKRSITFLRLAFRPPNQNYEKFDTGMGYGFLPTFWTKECNKRQLRIEIFSSRHYEYRYHVRIEKNAL